MQPDVVMVELCSSRMNILQYDEETLLREAKDISLVKIKQLIQQVAKHKWSIILTWYWIPELYKKI